MDDLNSTINSILGDPQKIEQLRAVAQSLGINPPGAPNTNQTSAPPPNNGGGGGGFDPSAIASILQNFQNAGGQNTAPNNAAQSPPAQTQTTASSGGGLGGIAGALPKVMEIMGSFNQSDKNVELLRALKPHFTPSRAGRIDDAVRIMQLMRAWPSLRDSGLLGNLGNLFSGGGPK